MHSSCKAAFQQLGLLSCQQTAALQVLLQQQQALVAAACSSSRCIATSSALPALGSYQQVQQQQQLQQQQCPGSSTLLHSGSTSRQLSSSSGGSSTAQSSSKAEKLREVRVRIFEQHIGDGRRSGRQVLLRPLKGRHIASWYFTLTNPKMPMLEDDIEEERMLNVQLARATGSGPPKKGQGKRAGKKK